MTRQSDYKAEILSYWLGPLDANGVANRARQTLWWNKDASVDAEIRQRFQPVYESIAVGTYEHWLDTPRGRLAYVIVLDQFARNMFRESPRMYAEDTRALAVAQDGITTGHDQQLGFHEAYFLYMPLMHAEDSGTQTACITQFEGLRTRFSACALLLDRALEFARQHQAIIDRFGRFPHRNQILGRVSTPEEAAFLTQPDSSF